jgi:hypothetical protein
LDIAITWPGTILDDHKWPLGTVMRWRLRFRELRRPRRNCCTSSATQAFSRHQAGMRLRERRRQIDSSRHEAVRMLTLGRSDRLKKGKGNRGSLTRARAFTGCDKLDMIFAAIFLVENLRRCNLHRMIDVVRLSLPDLYLWRTVEEFRCGPVRMAPRRMYDRRWNNVSCGIGTRTIANCTKLREPVRPAQTSMAVRGS